MNAPRLATVEELLAAARRHGLELDPQGARASEAGLDFFAVFARDPAGTEWVARSPRRADVVERARHEARVLAFVAPRLPAAVPDWRIHSDELIAYPKLAGTPAGEIDPEAKAYVWHIDPQALPAALVRTTAEALAALHAIDHASIAAAGFPVPDMAGVRAKIAGQMAQVRREIGVSDELWRQWQTWLAADDLWPARPGFIHGDFHPGHMLVDAGMRLIGILDWTEGEVGDPTTDLASFQMIFGEGAMAALLDAYAAAGGQLGPRVREHVAATLAAYPAKIGLFALASGQDEFMTMARSALGVAPDDSR
jgi:macrolide phosphotransferase